MDIKEVINHIRLIRTKAIDAYRSRYFKDNGVVQFRHQGLLFTVSASEGEYGAHVYVDHNFTEEDASNEVTFDIWLPAN